MLEKAKIFVKRGDGQKETIEVLFNPSEYVIEKGNKYSWQEIPGLSTPVAQFVSGESEKLTMDLFFDTSEKKEDVRNHSSKISDLLNIDKDLHAPPVCEFRWGTVSFKGILESVSQKFTMFLSSGKPVRATLNVSFKKWQSITEQFQETPRQSSDRTKQRTLKQGEELWIIASQEYEDPACWREIAIANDIDNPRILEPGRQLKIPRLE
ncbi:MAG: LysM peptidoglycan-binding domain-containing protein [Firmicutes bacterium]|nr:LysM peptidoglycan-binding domain-containing protein [Bacillota bacterium]